MPIAPQKTTFSLFALSALSLTAACDGRGGGDGEAVPATEAPAVSDELFALGRALFFDKILSGNHDVACATCHHPALGTDDDLALSRGVGATGLGAARSGGEVIGRNAPALFNLHMYPTMFWDGRIAKRADGTLATPAGEQLTSEMEATLTYGVVAAQAMFPVASHDEMRGEPGSNDLAALGEEDFQGVWSALMTRLGAIPAYVTLFEEAYPATAFADMTFAHAANAIAGFELRAFERIDSPYQRFLLGDEGALTHHEERGMEMFFDSCGNCHTGPLLSDFAHHDTGLAQLGPGNGDGPAGHDDFGRASVTGADADRYAFRTSPLLNVELTAPYGHAGQFADLEAFLRHYDDAERELRDYDVAQNVTDSSLHGTVVANTDEVIDNLDRDVRRIDNFNVGAVAAFLRATTADDARDLGDTLLTEVPSGLPVD